MNTMMHIDRKTHNESAHISHNLCFALRSPQIGVIQTQLLLLHCADRVRDFLVGAVLEMIQIYLFELPEIDFHLKVWGFISN